VSVSYPEPLIATHTYLSTLYYTDPPGGGVPLTSTIVDVIPGSLRILRINITSSTMTFNITSNESSGRAIALFIQWLTIHLFLSNSNPIILVHSNCLSYHIPRIGGCKERWALLTPIKKIRYPGKNNSTDEPCHFSWRESGLLLGKLGSVKIILV
jgi:hypothetical protein